MGTMRPSLSVALVVLGLLIQAWQMTGQMGDMGNMGDMGDMMTGNTSGGMMGPESGQIGATNGGLPMILSMPPETQKEILKAYGQQLVQAGALSCNPFAGSESCVRIPEESGFSKACPGSNLIVDCAYKKEALRAVTHNPDNVMGKRWKQGFQRCDQCQNALHKLWCAQTVPKCGTFEDVVSEMLAVVKAIVADNSPKDDALRKAMPNIFKARSLHYPCKEMCLAVIQTCSCGKETTFGKTMETIERRSQRRKDGNVMGGEVPASVQNMYAEVWDTPVCDLFAERSTPGFSGVCDVDTGLQPCGWCGKDGAPLGVEEQIVEQSAFSVSSMLESGVENLFDQVQRQDSVFVSADQASGDRKTRGHGAVVGILLTIVLLLTAVGVGIAILFHYRKRPMPTHHYVDLSRMSYTPPML